MIFTFTVYNFILITTYYLAKRSSKKYYLNLSLIVVILTFFATIRYDVGADYSGYVELISNTLLYNYNILHGYEPSFILTIYLTRIYHLGYNFFFFLFAFITWLVFVFSFRKRTKLFSYTLLFLILGGFYFWTFNGVRQAVAIVIFFYSVRFIQEKKLINYFFTIIIGSIFHYSILLLFPLYFFINNKISEKVFSTIPVLCLYIITFLVSFTDLLKRLFLAGVIYFPRYQSHIEELKKITLISNTGLGYTFGVIIDVILILCSGRLKRNFPESKAYINIFLIGTILGNMTYGMQILSRFVLYFTFFRFITLAYLILYLSQQNGKDYKLIKYGLIIAFIILFFFSVGFGEPYFTIFNT